MIGASAARVRQSLLLLLAGVVAVVVCSYVWYAARASPLHAPSLTAAVLSGGDGAARGATDGSSSTSSATNAGVADTVARGAVAHTHSSSSGPSGVLPRAFWSVPRGYASLATSRGVGVGAAPRPRRLGTYLANESCPCWAWQDEAGSWHPWFPAPRRVMDHDDDVTTSTPAAGPDSGVIVYLARMKGVTQLQLSLQRLDAMFNDHHQVPVAVFHEDLTPAAIAAVRAATNSPSLLSFHRINMCVPQHVVRAHVPRHVASNSIGYRHMLRFYALMVASHPALQRAAYMMRMDSDSLLIAPLRSSPFRVMHAINATYGFVMLWRDTPELVRGLDTLAFGFRRDHSLPATPLLSMLLPKGRSYNGIQFWNNFEVTRMSWLRSALYLEWAYRVDLAGIMYYDRVGDAPLRTLAVAMLLGDDQVHWFPDVSYQHQDQFSCAPDAAALLASGLLDDRHRTVFQRVADADAAGSGAGQHDSNVVSASARSVEQVKPIPIGQVAVAAATQQPLQATPRSLGLRGGGNPVMSSLGRVSLSAAQMEAAQHSSAAARFSPSRQEQQVLDETVCTVVDSLQFIRSKCHSVRTQPQVTMATPGSGSSGSSGSDAGALTTPATEAEGESRVRPRRWCQMRRRQPCRLSGYEVPWHVCEWATSRHAPTSGLSASTLASPQGHGP